MPTNHSARGWRSARPASIPGTRSQGTRRGQSGAVTAETVLVLPLIVAVTLGLVWAVALAATQVRVIDSAREVARAVARDESRATSLGLGRRVAPRGAAIRIHESEQEVVVTVRAEVRGPGGLFAFVRGVAVRGEAVAAREDRP
jgi:Flp pilus assembly protein TadG